MQLFLLRHQLRANNTTGSGNYFRGDDAGQFNTSGGFNIYIGANAGNGAGVNGNNNMALGFESGRGNAEGFNNTFAGASGLMRGPLAWSTRRPSATTRKVNVSNALVLGDEPMWVSVPATPPANCTAAAGVANQAGLRLENLTSGSPATALNRTKFLTVDGSGNVILGSTNSSARIGAENWTIAGESLQNTNTGGVIIGQGWGRPRRATSYL